MSDDKEDLEQVVTGYLRTEYECPQCDSTVSLEGHVTGDVECDVCGYKVHIAYTV